MRHEEDGFLTAEEEDALYNPVPSCDDCGRLSHWTSDYGALCYVCWQRRYEDHALFTELNRLAANARKLREVAA